MLSLGITFSFSLRYCRANNIWEMGMGMSVLVCSITVDCALAVWAEDLTAELLRRLLLFGLKEVRLEERHLQQGREYCGGSWRLIDWLGIVEGFEVSDRNHWDR